MPPKLSTEEKANLQAALRAQIVYPKAAKKRRALARLSLKRAFGIPTYSAAMLSPDEAGHGVAIDDTNSEPTS